VSLSHIDSQVYKQSQPSNTCAPGGHSYIFHGTS